MMAALWYRVGRLAAAAMLMAGAAGLAEETKLAPAPRTLVPKAFPSNPRGEPLLFQDNSLEIRPKSANWWSISISPDGQRIATSEGDKDGKTGLVRIWNRATGKVVKQFAEPKGVRAVAFSPDGKLLATGNYDAAIRFYDAADFRLLAITDEKSGGHKIGVNGLCFFKDGKRLASAGLDNMVRIWDVAAIVAQSKGKTDVPLVASPIGVFEGHTQGVLSVAVSDDGKQLLSGGFDRTARCYDVPARFPAMGEPPLIVKKERVVLKGHSNTIETVAISPDGQLLATGSWDGQLLLRDRDGKKTEASIRFQSGVMCCAFSKDGKYIVAGAGNAGVRNENGEVRVWDIAKKQQAAYRGEGGPVVLGAAFLPDNKTVAYVGHESVVHVWEFANDTRKTLSEGGLAYVPQPFIAAALSPSGRFLAVSTEAKSVLIYDRVENKLVAELASHDDAVAGLAFSPNGKLLATASFDRTVKIWSTAGWKERRTLRGHHGWVLGVAFAPDSHTLATASYDKTVKLWNAFTGDNAATWNGHTAGVRTVAFSPDGKLLASGGSDKTVRIWKVAEGKVLFACKGHKNPVRSVVFSPDGRRLASGSEDRTVKLWNADTGTLDRTFDVLPEMATSVRFSPKGNTIAAGTFQGSIVILDPATGRTRQTLRGHNEPAAAIEFTPEGDKLLSVSADRTIRQWSAMKPADGPVLQTFADNSRMALALALASNGKQAATGSQSGSITFWNVLTGQPTATIADAHAGAIEELAWSGSVLLSTGKDGQVRAWGSDRHKLWSAAGRFAAFAPGGKQAAVAEGKDVVLRDAATGKEVKRLAAGHDGEVTRLAFSADGKRLLSAGTDTKIRLWNLATGAKLQQTPAFSNYSTITHLAFAPDGTRFAAAAYGPDRPPPDDMDSEFRVTREVRIYAVPAEKAQFANPITFAPQPSDQPITGLDWLANGKVLVTPASDGTVRFTEIGSAPPTTNQPQQIALQQFQPAQPPNNNFARETRRYRAHDSAVLASAMIADSRLLLTAGEDLAIKRWALPGTEIVPGMARIASPGLTRVWEMLPSPTGKYIVAAGEGDKNFRVYANVPTALPREPNTDGPAFALAYSPDHRYFATAHDKGVLVIREAANGRAIKRLVGLTARASSVAFAENGAAVIAVGGSNRRGESGEAIVWEFATGAVRFHMQAPSYQSMLAMHPDGKTAAGAGSDGTVRLWDVSTGHLVKEIPVGGALYSVAFDRLGQRLAIGSGNHTVRIWDAASEAFTHEIKVNKALQQSHAVFSPDGQEIVVAGWRGKGPLELKPEVAAYSLKNPEAKPRLFPAPAAVMRLAFLLDGQTLAAAGGEDNGSGVIQFYDFASTKLIGAFTGHRQRVQTLALSPDGNRLATTSWSDPNTGELRFWDARGLRPIATVPVPEEKQYVSCAAISPDGKLLVLGGWGQTLTAWDMSDPAHPKLRKQFKDHKAGLRSLAFDDVGARFVSTDESGMVFIWDAAKLAPIASFKASASAIYRARFTPDGASLVTASGNWKEKARGELRIWDARSGKEAGRFPDQSLEVWDIGFRDGGKEMITIGALGGKPDDAHVKVWNFATRQSIRSPVPNGTFKGARCVGISPDGRRVAIGSNTGPVKVFDAETWEEVLNLPELTNCTFRVSFSADGRNLYIASGDGNAISVLLPPGSATVPPSAGNNLPAVPIP